jgi:hypothetical protein
VRFWVQQRLLRAPMPLTGDRALPPDTPWQRDTWVPAFLMALAYEAADGLDRLVAMDRAATRAVAGRGRHSRAAPLVSAPTLAGGLDMAVKNATQLLCLLRRRPGATGAWPCVWRAIAAGIGQQHGADVRLTAVPE